MSGMPYSNHDLAGLRLAVAGAGVLGLSAAALATAVGARVTVFDPQASRRNASAVAAGMLAPALEAVLDGEAAHSALLREGYDAWPGFAAAVGVPPPPELLAGALYLDAPEALEGVASQLLEFGVAAERLSAASARELQPSLAFDAGEALLVCVDGRVDPPSLLARLAGRVREGGGEVIAAPCPEQPSGFDILLVAAGYGSRRWIERAPTLAALQPIKGHVLHFRGGPTSGPTLRRPGGYAAPQPRGTVFGATMEPGCSDLDIDSSTVGRLHAAASALLPGLAATSFEPLTGVRAAFADGRLLVGPAGEGLHLAVGARRNGWLLAPLVARAVVDGLQGKPVRAEFAHTF
jgi:glycine oxidase